VLSIRNIKKVFTLNHRPLTAVDTLSLDIAKGEIFGVIGHSGAGKSTLVRLLNCLEEPTEGTIFIDGEEMTKLNGKHLRKARQDIGMIFQHFNLLWSRTTAENIAFPLEIAGVSKREQEAKVKELIDLVGLTGKENAYPAQLSGGQKQRIGIARALANNPKVLLCDEATSALDPETTDAILNLLVNINQKFGITIVMITHEMDVIRHICDRVAVMEKGKIVEQGTVKDVFSNPKHQVTKSFIKQIIDDKREDDLSKQLANTKREGKVLQLYFRGTSSNDALISELLKRFSLRIHMLRGHMTMTNKGIVGTLILQVIGDLTHIQEAEKFIEEAAIEVEVLRDDT